jgi:predicted dehydrogenase
MTAPLQVAVIGLGIGEHHAATYAGLATCQLRWVCDLDPARASAVVARLGRGQVASSFEAVVSDPAVDVVSIASYDDAHAAQVLAALRAGKHVFVEKPLCRTEPELVAIQRAARAGGRHLRSNLVLRGAPLYAHVKALIASGDLGTVYAFDGDYLYGRLHKILDGWRGEIPDYSVMLGGGVHLVDLMLGLTAERPSAVTATGNRISTRESRFQGDDFVAATYDFPSGLVGRITANFGSVHRHHHVVRVFGTRGTFIYDDAGARLHSDRDPAVAPRVLDLAPLPPSKGVLIPDFVAGIRAGADPRAAADHEFDVIAACIAADQALAIGKPTEVHYD